MTTQQPEALIFANDRPTSLDDGLYQWAIDAEGLIRRLHAESEHHLQELRSYRITVENREARIAELEAQAQRVPLTEDQVRKNKTIRLMNASSGLSIGMLMGLVRAIERAQDEARGITQEKQG